MSSDVTANSRTVVHKGDGIVNVSALPDVCKTPTPAGPTPVPYPNVARSSDLADGAKHVTIEGNPVALENSKLKQSSGDEAGTLGGVVSGKNRGKMTWGTSSPDVCVEGKGVIRFADLTHHNCNSFNVIEVQSGVFISVVVYGDDEPCPICSERAPPHKALPERSETDTRAVSAMTDLQNALLAGAPFSGTIGGATTNKPLKLEKSRMVCTLTCEDCDVVIAAISSDPKKVAEAISKPTQGVPGNSSVALPKKPDDSKIFAEVAKSLHYDTWASHAASLNLATGKGPWPYTAVRSLIWKNKNSMGGIRLNPGRAKVRLSAYLTSEIMAKIKLMSGEKKDFAECAGPQAIALALKLGHRPHMMCEKWVESSKPAGRVKSQGVKEIDARLRFFDDWASFARRGAPTYTEPRYTVDVISQETKLGKPDTVPSCNLCKLQVPALLCNFKDKRCTAKK